MSAADAALRECPPALTEFLSVQDTSASETVRTVYDTGCVVKLFVCFCYLFFTSRQALQQAWIQERRRYRILLVERLW